ncbi:MAG TPA: MBL fold metallo-hydrolase [Streptosporangiaceae bacterium]|nr:MBL fold metallo-hydrolase [Streptosporangiaceae bacterium]
MDARIERIAGSVNSWVVGDDDEVIVIDPGESASEVLRIVGEREVLAVICTHGHARHAAAAFEVAKRDEAPVALHAADRLTWREAQSGAEPDIWIEDGGRFDVSDVTLEVIHAPGHTPGSVCLYSEELSALFSGDVVGGNGPVPHEGYFEDFPRQLSSIGANVLTLDKKTRILPGHGEESSVEAAERRFDSWVSAGPEGLIDESAD